MSDKELHGQLIRYDALFDEAEKIRIQRDEARDTVLLLRRQRATQDKLIAELRQERDEARADYERVCRALVKTIATV